MTEVVTSVQMRAVERAATEAGEVDGDTLMERAGAGAVAAMLAHWPELADGPHSALVLAGPGNNGGDGFVVARRLAGRGWAVEVFLYGDAKRLSGDARTNYARWQGAVETLDEASLTARFQPHGAGRPAGRRPDVIVDALFGTGLTRPLEPSLVAALQALDRAVPEGMTARLALDTPSGLCADSGRVLVAAAPDAAAAGEARGRDAGDTPARLPSHHDLTVTFHAAKLGHYLADGPAWCGALRVVDIGLASQGAQGIRLTAPDSELLAKRRERRPAAHKYDHGHALLLSGGPGRGGAARMAARAALRVGAGLVTLACPPAALLENAAQLDAIMLRPVADAEALAGMLAADARLNAVGLGPGLGGGETTRARVLAVLAAGRATALDADALTAFADAPRTLFDALHPRTVLTPHPGEFARIFPDIAAHLSAPPTAGPAYSRLDATREAAARAGCVVLLKGADTVIAAPDGEAALSAARYARAAPWLATAGAGDVLTGLVTGLLARGLTAFEAAGQAAHLHVDCARAAGPGLIAEDLPETLPEVFRGLEL